MRTRRTLIALVAVLALVLAACSGTASGDTSASEGSTTTMEIPDLEFGKGVMPFTVPEAWPMPEQAVIGSTMIDGVNGRTEVVVTYPATVSEIVTYYTTNLPIVGFEITSSDGTDGEWTMEFAGEGVSGTALFTTVGPGVSAGALTFDHG